jgi:hypothetical protein
VNAGKLSKRIPARTKTITFRWLRDFMTMDDVYRTVRESCGGTMLCCHWCKTKFKNGDAIWLAQLEQKGGNKVFCADCAKEAKS